MARSPRTRQTRATGVQGEQWEIAAHQARSRYTIGNAYAGFEEHQQGEIAPGKHADLVVLDGDPCQVDPTRFVMRVLLTLVDGQPVFEA
jgi:predicted amidohydrolase YtcJ